jgi:hypothetical protein
MTGALSPVITDFVDGGHAVDHFAVARNEVSRRRRPPTVADSQQWSLATCSIFPAAG